MFQPSQHDVRRFFCETWRKRRDALPLTPMEVIAADWVAEHPEYDTDLSDEAQSVLADPTICRQRHLMPRHRGQTRRERAARGSLR